MIKSKVQNDISCNGENNLKRVLDKFIQYQLYENERRTTSEVKLGLDPDPKKI